MTDETVLGGWVENGGRQRATFTFFQGIVGVRDRGGTLDLSYFAKTTPTPPPRVQGVVGGKLVTVLSVEDRHLDANGAAPRDGEMRVVTLTVAPVTTA
ncbi:hypothetical protein [Sphingomonas sp. TREG-RG-20F-R18-01]|uniref:hypothetical protein n=1 Tax=Sphingomonas sp. TREG-RG-20F-R18-01 TaxID=2914982 RepID=UPI001F57C06C|nr:hypothetical protein [Sphingomonas sp. TREG-RG-20F-R18-01]